MTVNFSQVSLKWGSPWENGGKLLSPDMPACLLPVFWHSCSLLCLPGHPAGHEGTEHLQEIASFFCSQSGAEIHSGFCCLEWLAPSRKLFACSMAPSWSAFPD